MFDMTANALNINAWLIILVVAILLFGAQRIPEMMKGFGSGIKEFKKGLKEEDPEEKEKKA